MAFAFALTGPGAIALAQPAPGPGAQDATGASADEAVVPAIDRVRLSEDGQDRLTIPVTIDGRGPFDFLIDTGAQATIVSDRLVDRLGLRPSGATTIVSTASAARVPTVRLGEIAFANRSLRNLRSPVLAYENLGVDGILGLDALQDLRVLIDFRRGRMDVVDAGRAQGDAAPAYEIVVTARRRRNQMIIADARIDGVQAAVIIDTGAQTSLGNLALLRRLRAREGESVDGTDVLGTRYQGRIAFLRQTLLGRLELGRMPVAFVDSPAFDALGYSDTPALLLGIGNLRRLDRIAIDFRQGRVLFDVPDSVLRRP